MIAGKKSPNKIKSFENALIAEIKVAKGENIKCETDYKPKSARSGAGQA